MKKYYTSEVSQTFYGIPSMERKKKSEYEYCAKAKDRKQNERMIENIIFKFVKAILNQQTLVDIQVRSSNSSKKKKFKDSASADKLKKHC